MLRCDSPVARTLWLVGAIMLPCLVVLVIVHALSNDWQMPFLLSREAGGAWGGDGVAETDAMAATSALARPSSTQHASSYVP